MTVLLGALLAACSPGGAEQFTPSPTPTPTPTAAPSVDVTDPAVVRSTGLVVTSGAVSLSVVGADVAATGQDDGSVRVSAPGGDALVAAPVGMVLAVLTDGSAVVRDAAGTFVAGLTTEPWGARLSPVGPEVARLTVDATGPATVWLAATAVQSAVWGEAEGGTSLAVTPSAWSRAGSLAAQEGLWAQLVAQAPDADTPGMRAQLECHELGAPDKATWNLEPWRPEVGVLEMISERCNP